eukprot:2202015-Prymnesium_polylepis.1
MGKTAQPHSTSPGGACHAPMPVGCPMSLRKPQLQAQHRQLVAFWTRPSSWARPMPHEPARGPVAEG